MHRYETTGRAVRPEILPGAARFPSAIGHRPSRRTARHRRPAAPSRAVPAAPGAARSPVERGGLRPPRERRPESVWFASPPDPRSASRRRESSLPLEARDSRVRRSPTGVTTVAARRALSTPRIRLFPPCLESDFGETVRCDSHPIVVGDSSAPWRRAPSWSRVLAFPPLRCVLPNRTFRGGCPLHISHVAIPNGRF